MEEKEFPIYVFKMVFSSDDWGTDGMKVMLPRDLSDDEVDQYVQESLDANLDKERAPGLHNTGLQYNTLREAIDDGAIEVLETSWKFLCDDTWCSGWFSHYTRNTHLSDQELLESFERYVTKHRHHVKKEWESYDEYFARVVLEDRRALMGAGDRWRWQKPCRCAACTERGIISIDH